MSPYTISIKDEETRESIRQQLLELRILESKIKVEASDLVDKELDAFFGTEEDANVERE